jgi:phosphoribosyl 1,2-cyclic phosphodiesterase/CheY-like chemotaxis protein
VLWKATVLIVDDDPIVQTIVSRVLEAEGYTVIAANDGEAGLQLALSQKPDVAILDLMMPRMHGFAVIEAIRQDPSAAGIKIIVSSMKSYASDAHAALNLGANRFLTKPVAPADLIRTVRELIDDQPVESRPGEGFRVKFWGTRGSIATPGPRTIRYGGNTSCTEVRYGEHILILDAGTGIRELGESLMREFQGRPIRAHIFVGHTHWDHIQGFPFFVPAYVPGNEISLYSVRGAGKPLEKIFIGQMDSDYFPVVLSDLKAQLNFIELHEPVTVGPIRVEFTYLNHPGLAIGFRISAGGKSVAYCSDHESFARMYGPETGEREDRRITEFVSGVDLFISEAQYTSEEYSKKRGWGHSTFDDALRTAAEAKVRRLAIFHHDPAHDDEFMDRILEECRQKAKAEGMDFDCTIARENQIYEL